MKALSSLVLFGAVVLAAPAALADDVGGLPSWAAPSSPPPAAPAAAPSMVPAPPPPPDPVPLDGGLGLLALAGAGYAAKKLRARSAE